MMTGGGQTQANVSTRQSNNNNDNGGGNNNNSNNSSNSNSNNVPISTQAPVTRSERPGRPEKTNQSNIDDNSAPMPR